MKTFVIISKRYNSHIATVITEVQRFLEGLGSTVYIDTPAAPLEITSNDIKTVRQFISTIDYVVSIGGDGTVISTDHAYNKPIIAINMGKLGFLTEVAPDNFEKYFEALLQGDYTIQERIKIHCKHMRPAPASNQQAPRQRNITHASNLPQADLVASYHCLNDVVIARGQIPSIINLDLFVNGDMVCKYHADGVIVSTPTGSTAYNMAAGGPIVHPDQSSFIITPISPHSLSDRPVVVPSSHKIIVRGTEGYGDAYITADGQLCHRFLPNDYLEITISPQTAKLVKWDYNFYSLISEKLHWGRRSYA